MTITTRAGKGSELTHNELDTNFTDLRDGIDHTLPTTKGTGTKLGTVGDKDFGWQDLVGKLEVYGEVGDATREMYRGGIRAIQFDVSDSAYVDFHIPHDYLPGSQIHVHVHWSHASATVTGGSVTWGIEMIYAKGHNQGAFGAPIIASVIQNDSLIQYQHMIAETAASVTGGSGVALDTDLLETDGVIQCRIYLDSNDITDSVSVPKPFVHFVDIHYQSTGTATKNKSPDFWS